MSAAISYCRLSKPAVLNRIMESKTGMKIMQLERNISKAELMLQRLSAEIDDIKAELVTLKGPPQPVPVHGPLKRSAGPPVGPLTAKRLMQTHTGVALLEKAKKAMVSFDKIDDYVVVYTDGACPNNGKNGARAGIGVWFGENHPLNLGKRCPGNRQTNNAAEILACAEACQIAEANDIEKLQINTDSKFVIDCVTKWMPNWKKKNWVTAVGKPVINKEELIILENSAKGLKDVKYNHVSGHAGIQGNEGADKLAVKGANM